VTSTETQEVIELEIGNVAGGGGCVARAPDGRVVFVRHSLPGERVMAAVTAATTSYLRADAVEILRASPDRVAPPCPFAGPGRCGGCDFQHVSLAGQRTLKAYRIAEQLERLAGIEREVEVETVRADEDGLGWRTRVRLAADDDGHLGFRRHRSHQLEYVDHCLIAAPEIAATGAIDAAWPGVDEVEVIVTPGRAGALICVDPTPRARPSLPPVSAGLVVRGRVVRQPDHLETTVLGSTFRVSAGVFWQVHLDAPAVLAGAVRQALGAGAGDRVVDLYAGAGLFSVLLAADVGGQGSVLAVERDRRACADAEHNGRALPQLEVMKASVSPKLVEHGIGRPDFIVLDPAREGAGRPVMAGLAAHAATLRRLVYVSCDPASFSRDIRVLLDENWSLTSLRAFDIFPMTEHVELVARLVPPPAAG
jgi:tRNA/tmRNA/rRNA uracil-C5-methylase (TrmA/RlmC/RlmD family)